MEDLSLHILDIAENSLNAGAGDIRIVVKEDVRLDLLTLEVTDNGQGMDASLAANALYPFCTTRTTRRVGLGLPLLDEAAKAANGSMSISSIPGKGTTVTATFQLSHIDRKPLGRMADTITTIVARRPDVNIDYIHERSDEVIQFNTKEIKQQFPDLRLDAPQVLSFIREYLTQEEESLLHHA